MIDVFAIVLLPLFYLVGALPTGHLIARRSGVRVEELGSGNVGATNVARVLGKQAGIITLVIDILKGYIGTLVAMIIFKGDLNTAAIATFLLVAGHCFSIPTILKGGKGVATTLGVFLALSHLSALIGIIIFAGVFYRSKIVSLSSILAVLITPIFALYFTPTTKSFLYSMFAIALLVVFQHKNNLIRISEGREKPFKAA